jgi:hypothetical protein
VSDPTNASQVGEEKETIMKKDELQKTHQLYQDNKESWGLYDLIYKSGRPLIKYALKQNPRESTKNWKARVDDGYVFNFGKAIIDLFHFCLTEKGVVRNLEGLHTDPLWEKFKNDSDLRGTNYDVLMNECQKFASVYGAMGLLVNKPASDAVNLADEISDGVYPYIALYTPLNILDWQFEKNQFTHRDDLVYLKLLEANGDYLIWTPTSWEIWRLDNKYKNPRLIDTGVNELGEIPFVWMSNMKDLITPEIGISDLIDISSIVLSITQNLSSGEEIIKFAGFPIMRMPYEREQQVEVDGEVPVAVTSVLQYDPTLGETARPDWMPTEILEPISSILQWIDRKTDEIFRVAHLSGVHGQRKSNNEVASGMALRYEYDQLNSALVAKSINQVEAEIAAMRFWLKWQNKKDMIEQIDIKPTKEFSIDDLSIELDNAMKSMKTIVSKQFRVLIQQKIAAHALPDITQKDRETINKEIEAKTPEDLPEEKPGSEGGLPVKMGDKVRSAVQAKADHSKDGEKK